MAAHSASVDRTYFSVLGALIMVVLAGVAASQPSGTSNQSLGLEVTSHAQGSEISGTPWSRRERPPNYSPHSLRILVTGGAGFIGSHLVDRLMDQGHTVIVLDNLFTGSVDNIRKWVGNPNFDFVRGDVRDAFHFEVDRIFHLACPASPVSYKYDPVYTLRTAVTGTWNALELAKRVKARVVIASTSEVYGDPLVHPQPEAYWGNVNPVGERSCYDEGKRAAETLATDMRLQYSVDVRIARIFNTYGPRMALNDGRVVSNFVKQALLGQPLTVQGSGKQTRSFCFVSDLVEGLLRLMNVDQVSGPVNLGNPAEFTIVELAQLLIQQFRNASIAYVPLTADDPQQRQPDIQKARSILNWEPSVPLTSGLAPMIEDFRQRLL
mmetsp:Transcript_17443/g.36221  ORF Transcript_17443/g.36221 Transcript_17443/m.36221 type:complete len:380 (-) Transcript_17443:2871-4010(-)